MNIKNATIHIKNTLSAYLTKDEAGEYIIPVAKQRPIFLYGPPGIGKTAVMEQIAEELNIGIVSYSMTHHTRQSAIGLPFITKKKFGETEFDVSEYTMSEILASVYEYIEKTGKKEGILFLDEINCVSETLAPSMLRFLQYKSFGSHEVPKGWVVVTAGNPPEYNRSVRAYDIATLDRIKKIDVDADYDVWRQYALNQGVHPAIIAYLDVKNSDFYIIENTPDGKFFVTARGWEDLSRIMHLFEDKGFPVDLSLIEQYIQVASVAADFADYYETFKKIGEIYSPDDILEGKTNPQLCEKLKDCTISEKLGFINLLSNTVSSELYEPVIQSKLLKKTVQLIKEQKLLEKTKQDFINTIYEITNADNEASAKGKYDFYNYLKKITEILNNYDDDTLSAIKAFLQNEAQRLNADVNKKQSKLINATRFIDNVFGDSPGKQIFVSDITLTEKSAEFLIMFGCQGFTELTDSSFNCTEAIKEIEKLI